jgi:ABC-type transporter Mla subunit MlaD
MNDINELSKEVNALRADMAQVNILVDRLDVTIAKLTEVSTTVSQLLAVQGNRLEQQEKSSNQLSQLLEKRRDEAAESTEMLHKRISSAEKDFKTEIEKLNERILDEMKAMREENSKSMELLNNKITIIEKWMWVMVGGGAVIGFLLSKVVNLSALFR